jgi:hypothetical protein
MIYSHKSSFSLILLRAPLLLAPILASCGGLSIGLGGGNLIGDARPTGIPVKQAQFGVNAYGVSGSALIFISGTVYTLRLESLAVPVESNLQAWVYFSPGASPQLLTLRPSVPNQNHTLSAGTGVTFSSVSIYSNQLQISYAAALFPTAP